MPLLLPLPQPCPPISVTARPVRTREGKLRLLALHRPEAIWASLGKHSPCPEALSLLSPMVPSRFFVPSAGSTFIDLHEGLRQTL